MAGSPFTSPYIPNTEADQAALLQAVGVSSVEDLFAEIPAEFRGPPLRLPNPVSELELMQELGRLAQRNFHAAEHPSFLGAGVYRHFTPAVVAPLVSRGEFLTSYTPYQPEVSQGTLQATFEFQTMTCQLLDMPVANAGMYDGATSLAEAALMACRITQRFKVGVLDTVNPSYAEVVRTYVAPQEIEVYTVESASPHLQPDTACLLVQSPNFFGYVEALDAFAELAHKDGALLCTSTDPVAVAMLKPPGACGTDIATAEGQALGVPPSYGGPYAGLFACRQEFIRQMPGRIVGRTVDTKGRAGYVLTLQPREQHIRRERATSNICTSTALIGLWATVWTACMGKRGLRHLAELCYQKAHYAAARIAELPGYAVLANGPKGGGGLMGTGTFFQEFVVTCPRPYPEINASLERAGIIGGLDVSGPVPNGMLLCVTEVSTRKEIDLLVAALREAA